jgi:hypothetical protein
MQYRITPTADGTISCLDSETGELCHNRAGAYTEALKNYAIPSGAVALAAENREIRLLDACYGLGYNSWVLFDYLLQNIEQPFTLSVTAIEQSEEILSFSPRILDYPTFDTLKMKTGLSEHNIDYRTQICFFDTKVEPKNSWNVSTEKKQELSLEIRVADLRKSIPELDRDFDLIFHDPFSPQKMPELWTVDIFRHYYRLLEKRQGALLTYSAAAAVRGGLLEAGFRICKTEALGNKNGGTLASISSTPGELLNDLELAYLQTRSAIPYRDPDLTNEREFIISTRELEQDTSARPSGSSVRQQILNRRGKFNCYKCN